MNTFGLSSHTPLTEVIKQAWLDILHLTDVFDVVEVSNALLRLRNFHLIKVVPQ